MSNNNNNQGNNQNNSNSHGSESGDSHKSSDEQEVDENECRDSLESLRSSSTHRSPPTTSTTLQNPRSSTSDRNPFLNFRLRKTNSIYWWNPKKRRRSFFSNLFEEELFIPFSPARFCSHFVCFSIKLIYSFFNDSTNLFNEWACSSVWVWVSMPFTLEMAEQFCVSRSKMKEKQTSK